MAVAEGTTPWYAAGAFGAFGAQDADALYNLGVQHQLGLHGKECAAWGWTIATFRRQLYLCRRHGLVNQSAHDEIQQLAPAGCGPGKGPRSLPVQC